MTQPEAQTEHKSFFSWIGILGVLAVLLGVWVLLIDNWIETPDWLKILGGGGVLWVALTGAIRFSGREERWPRDLFLLLHAGGLLLMFAMIAMIYHLDTNPWKSLALCALLTLPGALSAELAILGDVVIVYSLMSLFAFIGGHESLHPLLQGFGFHFFLGFLALVLFSYRQQLTANRAMKTAVTRWGWILAGFALMGALISFSRYPIPVSRADHWLMLAFVGACIFFKDRVFGARPVNGLLFWLGALLLPLGVLSQSILGEWSRLLIGFALMVWFLVSLVQHCLSVRNASGARWGLLFLVMRILFFYGELLGDSASSGLWLILLGALLGGLAYAWSQLQPTFESIASSSEAATPEPISDQRFVFSAIGIVESIFFLLWVIILELR